MLKADDKCVVKLYSTGTSDLVAWYRVWEAVEATFSVCGRHFKSGSYRGIGQFSWFVMSDGGKFSG